jgi:hypothetical protein
MNADREEKSDELEQNIDGLQGHSIGLDTTMMREEHG